jgi:hypothetical protein
VTSYFVECQVPRDVAFARLRERAKAASVSDGRVEIYDAFAADWHPPAVDVADHALLLDTALSGGRIDAQLRKLLDLDAVR